MKTMFRQLSKAVTAANSLAIKGLSASVTVVYGAIAVGLVWGIAALVFLVSLPYLLG